MLVTGAKGTIDARRRVISVGGKQFHVGIMDNQCVPKRYHQWLADHLEEPMLDPCPRGDSQQWMLSARGEFEGQRIGFAFFALDPLPVSRL